MSSIASNFNASSACSSVTELRVRNPLLHGEPPKYENIKIQYVVGDIAKMNLRPSYQREIRWNQSAMNDLIGTIMENGLIPGILSYKLQPGDERFGEFKSEIIDGQHRLFTIYHFRNNLPVKLPGKKPFMIQWVYDRTDVVFYSPSDATREWELESPGRVAKYMTEQERDDFDEYCLEIRTLKTQLSLHQRCKIFCSLQNGVKVINSDRLKNELEVRFIEFASENALGSVMTDKVLLHCSKKAPNYWVQWLTRFYLLNKECTDVSALPNIFVKSDSDIKGMINKQHDSLQTSEEDEEWFLQSFQRFTAFINRPELENIAYNPTQLFALFAHLAPSNAGREEILCSNMPFWAKKGNAANLKRMWENVATTQSRKEYFAVCMQELASIVAPVEPVRPQLSKKDKKAVWDNWFKKGHKGDFNCACCQTVITKTNWHCAHVEAWSKSGDSSVENMRPTCEDCNRRMGTQNMDEFIRDNFPQRDVCPHEQDVSV